MRLCASGSMSLPDFLASYGNFYWAYALDGHESDAVGSDTLAKYADRIAPHQAIADTVLAMLSSDKDAGRDSFGQAGRISSSEAMTRLKLLASGIPVERPNNSFKPSPHQGGA